MPSGQELSADANLVLAHFREQAGEMAQKNAVQAAIIDTLQAENTQLKSMIDDVSKQMIDDVLPDAPEEPVSEKAPIRKKK